MGDSIKNEKIHNFALQIVAIMSQNVTCTATR